MPLDLVALELRTFILLNAPLLQKEQRQPPSTPFTPHPPGGAKVPSWLRALTFSPSLVASPSSFCRLALREATRVVFIYKTHKKTPLTPVLVLHAAPPPPSLRSLAQPAFAAFVKRVGTLVVLMWLAVS